MITSVSPYGPGPVRFARQVAAEAVAAAERSAGARAGTPNDIAKGAVTLIKQSVDNIRASAQARAASAGPGALLDIRA